MQEHAIPGPWAAGERIVVCISEDPRAAGLVRYSKRLADRLHAPFTALSVETRRSQQLNEEQRDRIADTLRLAERLGGEGITIPSPSSARNIADDVVDFAHAHNATQIVIGKSSRSRWFEILHGSVVHDLVRRSGNISVHVIAGDEHGDPIPKKTVRAAEPAEATDLRPYVITLAGIAAAVGVGAVLWPWTGAENIGLVFLTAIVVIAVRFGLWASLLASIASALCYNFFFTEPYYTFTISDPRHVAVVFFTIVAVLVSNVAARARTQAVAAMGRVRTIESLYAFSRKLAGVATLDDALWATTYQIALMLKVRVVVLLPEHGTLAVKAGYPPEDMIGEADVAAAKWAWENDRAAGRGSDTLPGAKRLFLPMRTGRGPIGIIGIDGDKPGPLLTPDQRRLLDALSDQSAIAIERVRLVEEMDRVKRTAETDRLRSALLTSISHDLKTPLAAILGAGSTLRDLSTSLTEGQKAELVATIIEESERLNRFIANLLDMTRLESGALAPHATPCDLGEVVGSALRRADKILSRHHVEVAIAPGLPILEADAVLLEQALFNILDNAAKYAPEGSNVRIEGWRDGNAVELRIMDEGPGIPPDDLERIFDKFHRVTKGDQIRPGTGLGLAISRGFVEAMHGTVTAANRTDRSGAVLTIRLPIPASTKKMDAAS